MPTPEEEFLGTPESHVEPEAPPEPAKPAPETGTPSAGEPEASGENQEPEGEKKPEAKADDDKGKQHWSHRRIDELTKNWREAERREAALKEENDRLRRGSRPPSGEQQGDVQKQPEQQRYTEADVERRAGEMAAQREFNRQCDAVHADGMKAYPDFGEALTNYRLVGGLKPELVEAAIETGSGAAVLYELGKNIDEADRIMKMSPTRMAVAVAKLAEKTSRPAPAAVPPVSKAPTPIKPISNGAARPGPKSVEEMSMAEFADYEAGREAKRRA